MVEKPKHKGPQAQGASSGPRAGPAPAQPAVTSAALEVPQAALADPVADPVDAWREEDLGDAHTQPEQSQATA